MIEPVPGAWGRKGSTFVWHEKADEALIAMLLAMAPCRRGVKAQR
ncbi:MAG: hypothetical protein WDM85_12550 [Caulobacteraceae bacterium]